MGSPREYPTETIGLGNFTPRIFGRSFIRNPFDLARCEGRHEMTRPRAELLVDGYGAIHCLSVLVACHDSP
jgi:hypothetical protein